jgi:hypothetical protein
VQGSDFHGYSGPPSPSASRWPCAWPNSSARTAAVKFYEGRDNLAYAVPVVLEPLGWLAGLDFVYWGDVDMHGFVILNRLRYHLPHARSMLMDRATLLGRREHWATKPFPAAAALDPSIGPSQSSTPTSS